MDFANGAIREDEWKFLSSFIEEHSIKNVLEIGCGYSTVLLSEKVDVVSYDTSNHWIEEVRNRSNAEVNHYKYPNFPEETREFDLAFVDGPASSKDYCGRYYSMMFAKSRAKYIAIHDFSRKEETKAINKAFPYNKVIGKKGSLMILDNSDFKPKNKYAIFVASDNNYLKYANVLLNSIEKKKINCDVYFIHYGVDEDYLKRAKSQFSFPLNLLKVDDDIPADMSKNMFFKKTRFKYIKEYSMNYDAVCLLDADMFIVNGNFMNLFDMVSGTDKLIGCNERYKWTFDNRYCYLDGTPILDKFTTATKFHCSVPIIFDMKRWYKVFDFYNHISFRSYEKGPKEKSIGDMYCWNLSVYKSERQNDVVLFPMQSMTQVHSTNVRPYTNMKVSNDLWITDDGDEVYTIHGRISDNWYNSELKNFEKRMDDLGIFDKNKRESFKNKAISTLTLIRNEWNFLSTYKVSM